MDKAVDPSTSDERALWCGKVKALSFGALPDQVLAGAYLVVHGDPGAAIQVVLA